MPQLFQRARLKVFFHANSQTTSTLLLHTYTVTIAFILSSRIICICRTNRSAKYHRDTYNNMVRGKGQTKLLMIDTS